MIGRAWSVFIRLPRGVYNRTMLPLQRFLSRNLLNIFLPRILAIDDVFNAHVKTPPNTLLIFPTNICNAKCTFCAYSSNADKKIVMPLDIAKKAIDDFIEMGGGEPLFYA